MRRIADSARRCQRLATSVPAITVSPAAMLNSAMARMANEICARMPAARCRMSRTGMTVTFGNAATTAS